MNEINQVFPPARGAVGQHSGLRRPKPSGLTRAISGLRRLANALALGVLLGGLWISPALAGRLEEKPRATAPVKTYSGAGGSLSALTRSFDGSTSECAVFPIGRNFQLVNGAFFEATYFVEICRKPDDPRDSVKRDVEILGVVT